MKYIPVIRRNLTCVSLLSEEFTQQIRLVLQQQTDWEITDVQQALPLVYIAGSTPDIVFIPLLGDDWPHQCTLIQQIRGLSPHTQIMVVVSDHNIDRIFAALQSGAIGFLDPNLTASMLLDRLVAAIQERGAITPELARMILAHSEPREDTEFLSLEVEFLHAFAQGRTMEEVQELFDIEPEYLARHLGNILLKITVPPDEGIIDEAFQLVMQHHQKPEKTLVDFTSAEPQHVVYPRTNVHVHKHRSLSQYVAQFAQRYHPVASSAWQRLRGFLWVRS
jgi:DNA-binding NarL/FixJ family response regulator